MIHAVIDLYVKDRDNSEFSDSQTIAEMLMDDLVMSKRSNFLQPSDDLFANVTVFNNETRNRGSASYRTPKPHKDLYAAISKALEGYKYE